MPGRRPADACPGPGACPPWPGRRVTGPVGRLRGGRDQGLQVAGAAQADHVDQVAGLQPGEPDLQPARPPSRGSAPPGAVRRRPSSTSTPPASRLTITPVTRPTFAQIRSRHVPLAGQRAGPARCPPAPGRWARPAGPARPRWPAGATSRSLTVGVVEDQDVRADVEHRPGHDGQRRGAVVAGAVPAAPAGAPGARPARRGVQPRPRSAARRARPPGGDWPAATDAAL